MRRLAAVLVRWVVRYFLTFLFIVAVLIGAKLLIKEFEEFRRAQEELAALDGGRQAIDNNLFKKAGINSESATILHFYPTETENLLVNIEVAYRNKKSTEIRKTYFAVRKDGTNYRFAVTSQSNLR